LRHDLFRHEEMEILVPESRTADAVALVRLVVATCAGVAPAMDRLAVERARALIREAGMEADLHSISGCYTQHYPILFRRVMPDDTLLSMTADAAEPYQAISFFCYEPAHRRAGFYRMTRLLARVMNRTLAARLHWGKHFPLSGAEIRRAYPSLGRFRAVCQEFDARGVFRNAFTEAKLGF
jgi:L-gulono-1,4-lactone dehydrogenase